MTHEDWPVIVANIPVGGTWELPFTASSDDGLAIPLDWDGVVEFTGQSGVTFATLHTDPAESPDGTITLEELDETQTRIVLNLPSSFTATLLPVRDDASYTPQQAGIGTLHVWDPATPTEKWRVCDFWVRIY